RLKLEMKLLPQSGRVAGVGSRRVAVVAFVALSARRIPALVDPAAVAGLQLAHAPAVKELHFIATLQIDPRVGARGEQELEIEFEVAVFPGGQEMTALVLGWIADEHAGPGGERQDLVPARIAREFGGELPVGAGRSESGERIEGDRIGR